ncbi:Protein CBG18668 [Caenorhabditis briggsae]|uniref:Protein CBG18668 n=1 Tax=Caenorhabditis briggsae TaxID=6238 RepID=A8XTV1_CAEBR|nr:Protein CBG18668 [Caenorhabditis briggsae]CAP36077.2 Protein CBG18668 [Caenorhabditis briggsae]
MPIWFFLIYLLMVLVHWFCGKSDEQSDILMKNVLGKSKKWNNKDYLSNMAFLFFISLAIEWVFVVVDLIRHAKDVDNLCHVAIPLMFFMIYNCILWFTTIAITSRITQGFLKIWSILAIFNIFIGFGCLFHFYNHFTTDPNAGKHFYYFKCTLISMPIWFSFYIFANGFGALVLWKIRQVTNWNFEKKVFFSNTVNTLIERHPIRQI